MDYTEKDVCISNYPLSAALTCAKVCSVFEPEDPPFTAYLGKLPNGIVQEDVQDMFNKLKVRSIVSKKLI